MQMKLNNYEVTLTTNSIMLEFNFSSPISKKVFIEFLRILEKTSNCWEAVEMLVISL